MSFCFGKAEDPDVQAVYSLIEKRVAWMDQKGIHQWNDTGYLQAYPLSYYKAHQEQLYVIRDAETGRIASAAILLEQDDRWNAEEPAFYIHNFVSDVQLPGSGTLFLQEAEKLAVQKNKQYLRLDSAVDNTVLEAYYEKHGFQSCGTCEDGPYHGILRQKKVKEER